MNVSKLKQLIKMIITESYKFKDFHWLGNHAGFGVPSDVYKDTAYIGTIESEVYGKYYRIVYVDTPKGNMKVEQSEQNQFKSKNQAAEILHKTWAHIRRHGLISK